MEENELVRAGLRTALWIFGIAVVGEALDADGALASVTQLSPAAVVVGLSGRTRDGVEAIGRLTTAAPKTPVIVLGDSTEREDVTAAVVAGARGYMLKDAGVEAIAGAVRAVASGDSAVSARIAGHLLDQVRNGRSDGDEARAEATVRIILTCREFDVLQLIAAGKENCEIASALSISPSTAKNHTSSILAKLHVDNRIQAAVYAVRSGVA